MSDKDLRLKLAVDRVAMLRRDGEPAVRGYLHGLRQAELAAREQAEAYHLAGDRAEGEERNGCQRKAAAATACATRIGQLAEAAAADAGMLSRRLRLVGKRPR